MADKIDMSLDDIINKNRGRYNAFRGGRGFRGRSIRGNTRGTRGNMRGTRGKARGSSVVRGRGRGNVRGKIMTRSIFSAKRGGNFNIRTNNVPNSEMPRRGGLNNIGGPSKLLISNLDYGVSNSDIKELFAEFGAIRKAVVHYDQSGRSLGTADVVFERRGDAARAMNHYNGVALDGRAMKIQITTSFVPRITVANQRGSLRGRFSGRGRGMRGRGRGRGAFNRT